MIPRLDLLAALSHHAVVATIWLASSAIVLTAWERLSPANPGQRRSRRDLVLDLACSYVVPLITFLPYAVIMSGVGRGLALAGAMSDWRAAVGSTAWALQLPVALLAADVVGYWRHRAFHGRMLWRFHATHHSSEQLDWLSNERFHPVDALVTSVAQAAVLLALGFAPEVVAINGLVRRAYAFYLHANVSTSYGWWDRVFVSPLLHRWHHSDDPRLRGRNLAPIFAFVDVTFGTYLCPEGEVPRTFGLGRTAERQGHHLRP